MIPGVAGECTLLRRQTLFHFLLAPAGYTLRERAHRWYGHLPAQVIIAVVLHHAQVQIRPATDRAIVAKFVPEPRQNAGGVERVGAVPTPRVGNAIVLPVGFEAYGARFDRLPRVRR